MFLHAFPAAALQGVADGIDWILVFFLLLILASLGVLFAVLRKDVLKDDVERSSDGTERTSAPGRKDADRRASAPGRGRPDPRKGGDTP